MKVEKRDGAIQQYNFTKIENAVTKVFSAIGEDVPEKFIDQLKEHFDNIIAIEGKDLEKEYEGEVNIYQDLNTSNTSVSFLNSAKFSIKSDASSEEYKDYNIEFGDNVIINLKDLKTKEYYIENIKIKGLSIGKEIIAKINYYQHNLTRNGG